MCLLKPHTSWCFILISILLLCLKTQVVSMRKSAWPGTELKIATPTLLGHCWKKNGTSFLAYTFSYLTLSSLVNIQCNSNFRNASATNQIHGEYRGDLELNSFLPLPNLFISFTPVYLLYLTTTIFLQTCFIGLSSEAQKVHAQQGLQLPRLRQWKNPCLDFGVSMWKISKELVFPVWIIARMQTTTTNILKPKLQQPHFWNRSALIC